MARSAISCSSSTLNTCPVGLCGVLMSISLVFGVIAARNSSGSKPYDGGRSVTGLATAPARAMHAW